MLPNRTRLRGWNPDSLIVSVASITHAAREVDDAVSDIDGEIRAMPEAQTWSGRSHEAATAMFDRAHRQTTRLSAYAAAVSQAIHTGADEIGRARRALLDKADELDGGPLHVDDTWVVLVDQTMMSAEQAAALEKQAEVEQITVNALLLDVGNADEHTASTVQAAARPFHYDAPKPSVFATGELPMPDDEVPNPLRPDGLVQQDMIRKNDLAQSVRDETVEYTSDDQVVTTLYMMDGSKHVIHEWGDDIPHISDSYYDEDGNWISSTMSFHNPLTNADVTEIQFGDGTIVTMNKNSDGSVSGGVTTADGRNAPLPSEFFTHPALTSVQGAMTLLDKAGETGRGIPVLRADQLDRVGSFGRYAGPAVGVATAILDVVTADTLQDACVAAIAAGYGAVGAPAGGMLAAGAASATPAAVPWMYAGGSVLGTWTFGYLGGIVGEAVCR